VTTAALPLRQPVVARRSGRELLLLAGLVVGLASWLLDAGTAGTAPPLTAHGPVIVLLVLAAVAQQVVVRVAPAADPVVLPIAVLLNGLGLVLIRRVDIARGSSLAPTQALWSALGLAVLVGTLLVVRDHRSLTRLSYTFGLLTLALLVVPLLPVVGQEVNGARLWVDLGPVRVQPGEAAKLTLVVFLAGYLERSRAMLSVATYRLGPLLVPSPRHLGPLGAAIGIALLVLVSQKDLGSSLLLFGVVVAMLYAATGRFAYPLLGAGAFAVGAALAYRLFAHLRVRVSVWIDPFADPDGAGYQIVQVAYALAAGGLTGRGLGNGRPQDIPFAWTDAVFAVAAEELGLLGATALLLAFALLVARGYRIALSAQDEVGTLLAVGLTTVLALQVVVIVGGLTRVIPLTGITLPLVSYGGSSLLANYALLALLLRVDQARAER
jgi:cell division protein FtsW (lipid II flippase)